jgi:heme O synthase-like polyprenyltransferase
MKAVPAWLTFTVLRVLMFVVPFVLLLVMGFAGWFAAVVAAVVGLCLSYIFLRTPRDTVARGLYEVRHREKEPVHPDAESEDAAVDRAEAGRSPDPS